MSAPEDGNAYHFEFGGGHWIFGSDDKVFQFIHSLAEVKKYERKSSVYFRRKDKFVPYPLQNNLRFLDKAISAKAVQEITSSGSLPIDATMKGWLAKNFGPTLCELFFYPFHELYTAGLTAEIAPQDAYKSPINLQAVLQGAQSDVAPVGYNATFLYPKEGLNKLIEQMASACRIHYQKCACSIDVKSKRVRFTDGSEENYDVLVSTLPLNRAIGMAGLGLESKPFPHTSVLVLNIGAVRGAKCPDDHWLYNPDAVSKFHRVGFYSNVDTAFLPKAFRETNNRVSVYVERGFPAGTQLNQEEIKAYGKSVIRELQDWNFIQGVEVADPTWVDVAYTWAYPDSPWREDAINALRQYGVIQIGRYGRWNFQGILESIKEGLLAAEEGNK